MAFNNLQDSLIDEHEVSKKPPFATFGQRVLASIIDFFVFIPIIALNFYNMFDLKQTSIAYLVVFLTSVYKPFMEFQYGATLGKMAQKLKVVNMDYGKIELDEAVLRFIPWIPIQIISLLQINEIFGSGLINKVNSLVDMQLLDTGSNLPIFNNVFSMLLFIGCLFMLFTPNKQALHDLMGKTFVVKMED